MHTIPKSHPAPPSSQPPLPPASLPSLQPASPSSPPAFPLSGLPVATPPSHPSPPSHHPASAPAAPGSQYSPCQTQRMPGGPHVSWHLCHVGSAVTPCPAPGHSSPPTSGTTPPSPVLTPLLVSLRTPLIPEALSSAMSSH